MNISKWPVVIFASPRTGSTPLGYHLKESNLNVKYFTEPNFSEIAMKEYLEYSKNNSNYILKLLGSSIPCYPNSIFLDTTFKIKITRRNIVEQVASHYLAMARNIWSYDKINDSYIEDIMIDIDSIKKSIIMIKYDRDIVDKISTDLELVYEDFNNFNSHTYKTPKPANYSELINTVAKFI